MIFCQYLRNFIYYTLFGQFLVSFPGSRDGGLRTSAYNCRLDYGYVNKLCAVTVNLSPLCCDYYVDRRFPSRA